MLQVVKNITGFVKGERRNCLPLCAHCEVEVTEKTAYVISRLINKRIAEISNLEVVAELQYQKDLILSGAWHEDYDTITK